MANSTIGGLPDFSASLPFLDSDLVAVSRGGVDLKRLTYGQLKAQLNRFSGEEVPAGAQDGANKTFVLSRDPLDGSLMLFFNGMILTVAAGDYTRVDDTLTLITYAPNAVNGDSLIAFYQY